MGVGGRNSATGTKSLILADAHQSLARLESRLDDLSAADGHRLAKGWVQDLLVLEVPASEWAIGEGSGVGPTHPPNVGG
jgi:hypothetical protein